VNNLRDAILEPGDHRVSNILHHRGNSHNFLHDMSYIAYLIDLLFHIDVEVKFLTIILLETSIFSKFGFENT
jgi:hypothetical protein